MNPRELADALEAKEEAKTKLPGCREALAFLDEILSRGDNEARALWKVLTALRGPDVDAKGYITAELKRQSTGVIRREAFPKTAEAYWLGSHPVRATFADRDKRFSTKDMDRYGDHFLNHLYDAKAILALMGRTI